MRVYGAEGVIDRDVETATFEALGQWLGKPGYLGRFGNGRCEEWLEGYRTLSLADVRRPELSHGIARAMARLHCFQLPTQLQPHFDLTGAGFWKELDEWFAAAAGEETRAKVCAESEENAALYASIDFSLADRVRGELKQTVLGAGAERFRLCFCHNDLLPANIMVREEAEALDVRIIDLEYGSVNYAAFDVANHLMEFAGGATPETLGVPDYSLLPAPEERRAFVRAYLEALGEAGEDEFLAQTELFADIDNIYWGLWGINQARIEGCRDFPYLLYGRNRLLRGSQKKGFAR